MCLLRVFAFADISGYRVKARYDVEHRVEARYDVAVTPHSDAGSSKVPLVSIAFADIPWIPHQVRNDETAGSSVCLLRVLPLPVFLDSASSAE